MNESPHRSWIARLFPARAAQVPSSIVGHSDASNIANNRGALYATAGENPPDYIKAAEFFRNAAEAGYALAQNNLGMMFASGHGVLRSEADACKWFRRAAEQGDAGGQFNLGNLCHPASLNHLVAEAGEARIQAYMWFSLAAAQGYYKADASCETLNMQMSKAEIDEGNRRTAAFMPRAEPAFPFADASGAPA